MQTTEQILPTMRRAVPQIYMYDDTSFPGWIKIGQTTRADVRKRIDEQHPITEPFKTYHLLWHADAFYADGSGESFSDHDLHEMLRRMGKELIGEWCRCSLREAKAAYVAVRHRDIHVETVRDLDYKMRDEQEQAVKQAAEYFEQMDKEEHDRPSHYLWNAKMRFGKTFATYQLAKRMKAKRVLVLTFKPAVEDSWRDDLLRHRDFEGWRYYSSREADSSKPSTLNSELPLVVFGSFQDYLGHDRYGNIKPKIPQQAPRGAGETDEVPTRIPIFMYLTDYREESLEDVIRKLEPSFFERVTGLTIDDFDLLLRVGVFNHAQMNDAILKFRRYEDASLAYTGVNRHASDTRIGLMDSSVPIEAML